MRFFRFVIILLSGFLHYHNISSPRISLSAYSSSPPAAGKHQAVGSVPTSQALHLSRCPISSPVTLLTLGL